MNWPPAHQKQIGSAQQSCARWLCAGRGPQGPAEETSSGWREDQRRNNARADPDDRKEQQHVTHSVGSGGQGKRRGRGHAGAGYAADRALERGD
jgi:hypothetical protein